MEANKIHLRVHEHHFVCALLSELYSMLENKEHSKGIRSAMGPQSSKLTSDQKVTALKHFLRPLLVYINNAFEWTPLVHIGCDEKGSAFWPPIIKFDIVTAGLELLPLAVDLQELMINGPRYMLGEETERFINALRR